MGMDLIGRNADTHFNWTGWRIITGLLEQLDVLTDEFSGSNDGDRISAKTCRACGKALREALKGGLICKQKIQDKGFLGGFREDFRVFPKLSKVVLGFQTLEQEDVEWFEGIAEFFETCGGCKQY